MRKVVRGLWDVTRVGARSLRRHPQAVDGAVAVALLVLSLMWLNQYPYEPGTHRVYSTEHVQRTLSPPVDVLGYALTVLVCATIALRRRWPAPMMGAACAMLVLYT